MRRQPELQPLQLGEELLGHPLGLGARRHADADDSPGADRGPRAGDAPTLDLIPEDRGVVRPPDGDAQHAVLRRDAAGPGRGGAVRLDSLRGGPACCLERGEDVRDVRRGRLLLGIHRHPFLLAVPSSHRIEHVSEDLPPDLPRLRTLETWLAYSLHRVQARISEVEQREADMRPRRQLPDGPTWVLSYLRVRGQATEDSVHLGGCKMASHHTRALTREQALRAITAGGIRACEICRPDSELGVLD